MLPNMASTVLFFAQRVKKVEVLQNVINYLPKKQYVKSDTLGTITTPKDDELVGIDLNSNLKYKLLHTTFDFKIGDYFIYKNIYFKVIKIKDRRDYAFFRCLGEEDKNAR